jgi:hypothetical protein
MLNFWLFVRMFSQIEVIANKFDLALPADWLKTRR